MLKVVLDTNIFVAAGFNPRSGAAGIIRMVEEGKLVLVWNEETWRETKKIVSKIPPLSWGKVAGLFKRENKFLDRTYPSDFDFVEDRDDRKFAALAKKTGAVLVSNDEHLLVWRGRLAGVEVVTSGELMRGVGGKATSSGRGAGGGRGV